MTANKRKNETTTPEEEKRAKIIETEDDDASSRPSPIPVTILSGFLGAGKTTLLKHILTSKDHCLKIAVIVNDMAELNIDGQTIRNTVTTKTKKEVITLQNGCICCTLRGDLIREINQIQKLQKFDYVLIESTGIAEPQQVAESFAVDPDTQAIAPNPEQMLWNVARLDTCVTVVDTVNFARYLSSLDRFKDVFQDGLDEDDEEGEGDKSISGLMVEQVEFANVIILNKIDLVDEKKIEITKRLIKTLNPKARVMEGSFGKVDLRNILNTNLFNMTEASESPGWMVSLKEGVDADHGEADEYGVTSFIYRERRPFHPYRLHAFLKPLFCFARDWENSAVEIEKNGMGTNESKTLKKKYGEILRSKGSCWIAGRDDVEYAWAQAGRIIQLSPDTPWHCKYPEEEWAESEEEIAAIKARFDGEYGDRRQEIVFIGTDLNQAAIEEELKKCLLSDEEMNNHTTSLPIGTYPDPLFSFMVACEGAQSVFMIARQDQNRLIRVFPGNSLCLENLALAIKDEDDEDRIRAVKVWLDRTDADVKQGVLLATLRPGRYEQHSMSLVLLPCDTQGGEEETNRRIRVEIIPSKGAKKTPDEWMMACEVHIVGKIEPLPYAIGSAEDGEHDHEHTGTCPI